MNMDHAFSVHPVREPKQRKCGPGDLTVDFDRVLLISGEKFVVLTYSEFRLVDALTRHVGFVMSRAQLLDAVQSELATEERSIDAVVKRVRRKARATFGIDPIETRSGLGYSWVVETI